MRKIVLLMAALVAMLTAHAQDVPQSTDRTTAFESFQPASITLKSGKTIKHRLANVFLKNSSLVYKSGRMTMEANPEQISSVDIGGSHYVMVDTALAVVVDTLESHRLLRVTMIDVEAYATKLRNSMQMGDFEIGSHVNFTATDLTPTDGVSYPLVNYYYFDLGGKIVKIHERTLQRHFPKDKRRMFRIIVESPDFKWDDPASLMRLLKEMI